MDKILENFELDFEDIEFQTDPWEQYRRVRSQAEVTWSEKNKCFFFMSFNAVKQGLVDDAFITEYPFRTTRLIFGPTIVDTEDKAHDRYKSIIGAQFHNTLIKQYTEELIWPIAAAVVDEVANKSEIDFISDIAQHIPTKIIMSILKLPVEDSRYFYEQMKIIIDLLDNPKVGLDKAFIASDSLVERIRNNYKLGCPFNASKEPMEPEESIRHTLLLLAAGTETTINSIGNIMNALLENPTVLEDVIKNPVLISSVVRETLRWQPPLHFILRYAKADVEVCGVKISKGSAVQLGLASASRDEAFYSEPNIWNPFRPEKRIIVFGGGTHACTGLNLAIKELEIIFHTLLSKVTVSKLVANPPNIVGRSFRRFGDFPVKIKSKI